MELIEKVLIKEQTKDAKHSAERAECELKSLLRKVMLASTLFLCFFATTAMYAQQSPITIQWTAEVNGKWHPLDRVLITNKSNKDTMTVYYPDTVFVCYGNVGISPMPLEQKTSLKTYPNPFSNTAQVDFSLAQQGKADLVVYDLLGREIVRQSFVLERGTHSVRVSLPNGMYLLSLQTADGKSSTRLLSEGKENPAPKIVYSGNFPPLEGLGEVKANNTDFSCTYGDTLVLQCFITVCDTFLVEEHIVYLTKDTDVVFRFSHKVEIPFTEYSLGSTACQWENFPSDTLIVINSDAELANYVTCMDYHAIDFNLYSLLLVRGITNYGTISHIAKQYVQRCNDKYLLNLGIHRQDTANSEQWLVAVLVPKIEQNAVDLNIYNPHIEVWKCFFEGYYYPDITITLVLDTLLHKHYVNTIPKQDLVFNLGEGMQISFVFEDDVYGTYIISEDTMYFYHFDSYPPAIFIRTMYSPDSMLLQYPEHGGIPEYFVVKDYLFIKQN